MHLSLFQCKEQLGNSCTLYGRLWQTVELSMYWYIVPHKISKAIFKVMQNWCDILHFTVWPCMPNSVLINHHWATHKHTQVFVPKYWVHYHCCPHMPNTGLANHDHANTKNTQAILNPSHIQKQYLALFHVTVKHFLCLDLLWHSVLTNIFGQDCGGHKIWPQLTKHYWNWPKNGLKLTNN